MTVSPDLIDEIQLLALFDLSSTQEGIKVHQHSASASAIAAAERLHQKGLTTQSDGGYLTSLGVEAAEHTQGLLAILSSG